MKILHNDKTELIIGCFYTVYNSLGYGFLEKVYENALVIELGEKGFDVKCQNSIAVHYKGQIVGQYYADLIIDDLVLLEFKAVETIITAYRNQIINYLKSSTIEVGLLMNFGENGLPALEKNICLSNPSR